MRLILLLTTSLLVAAPDSFAQLDPARPPTPLWRAPLPAYVPVEAGAAGAEPVAPVAAPVAPVAQAQPWARFERATRCVQADGVMRCDNGYSEETAR
jgi:hypothetical protein